MKKYNHKRLILYIVLLILILIIVWIISGFVFAKTEITLNDCFYYAPRIPYVPEYVVYGVIVDETLYKIIDCESDFQPEVCNAQYGCGSGQGLAQIIPGTLKHCEEKLGKELDVFNPKDNIECAQYLLEEEGDYHWDMSRHCWGKGRNQ